MTKMSHAGKVILFLALTAVLALVCFSASAEGIQDHVWNSGEYFEAATCSHGEIWLYTCTLPGCGATKKVEVGPTNPNAHKWGEWTVDKPATCTEAGHRSRVCAYVSHHVQNEDLPALGHLWDSGVVKKAPTCLTPGEMLYTCKRDSSHTYVGAIDPTGHNWGDWEDVSTPTCITGGKQKRVCKNDSSHVEYRDVSATGHNWGPWTVVTPATCEKDGKEERVCSKCGTKEQRAIPKTGHKWDNGTVIKQPTMYEEGIKQYVCQNDPSHVKNEKISRKAMVGTLCAFGFRLKDSNLYPYNYDKWYMYTPFDASMNGSQTFEVVFMDRYIPGTITITVSNGYLTVHEPVIRGNSLSYDLKFFTVLNKITDLTMYEPEQLMNLNMQFEQPYDMEAQFGEDRNLVLYLCSRVTAYYKNTWDDLNYKSNEHQRILDNMRYLMQTDTF
ncbi:MAG: hypothetical protein IKQ41_06900 [Clostridia bacterium]|nr:hypothetical protein [Clostridia bacterium]